MKKCAQKSNPSEYYWKINRLIVTTHAFIQNKWASTSMAVHVIFNTFERLRCVGKVVRLAAAAEPVATGDR